MFSVSLPINKSRLLDKFLGNQKIMCGFFTARGSTLLTTALSNGQLLYKTVHICSDN